MFFDHLFCWLDMHSGAITAVATAVIGIFTVTIWRVATKQLKLTRQTERAYLSAAGLMNATGFTVSVTNNGKTPGELISVCAEFCNDDAVPQNPVYDWATRRRQFSPGESEVYVFESAPLPAHFSRPLVYGAIKYLDVWQGEHIYGFVLRVHLLPERGVAGDIPEMPSSFFPRS
jgi:hypothetical protein